MPAVALTDHGNMFSAFEFVNAAQKAGIIRWWAAILCGRRPFSAHFCKEQKDKRYHQLLLAKIRRAIAICQNCVLWLY
ncbi:MAG: PHP domain-containing protein [Sphingobacteriales bacterium]|nr:PHP domain-containing protein [Sphingobacteriales bacterium]